MSQFRYRHNITDSSGAVVSGVSSLEPPPEVVELVGENQKADMIWKGWLENLYEYIGTLTDQTNQIFIVPTSINVATGGTPVGSVTDVQTLNDGNVYQVPEVAATPGFDIEFNFTGVREIAGFVSMIRYTGSVTHDVTLRLHNYTTVNDNNFLVIPHTAVLYAYRTVLIPDDTNYINSSGQAQLVLFHDSAGNPTHDVYVDYMALIGKAT